jgi:UDP-N-acetylglucosamine:LPS N-acetylglucosamine transferase
VELASHATKIGTVRVAATSPTPNLSSTMASKKILILSCNIGQGHMSAAKAIEQGLKALYGNEFEIEIIDFFHTLSETINKASYKLYQSSAKHAPALWELFFKGTNRKWEVKMVNMINYSLHSKRIIKLFQEKKPDLIISTYPVWDYLALKIWKELDHKTKFISVVTDSISIHKVWVTAEVDYHIVPNEDTAHSLRKLGAPLDKIKILGFPVRLNFLKKMDRKAFLKKLKLDPKKTTILFLPLAENIRKSKKILKELTENPKLNVIVVTGKNDEVKAKLASFKKMANVRIFGWTENLPELIKASNIVITKAGGATVMECLAAKKPMIITQIIPGQERGNAELLKRYHVGLIAPTKKLSITAAINQLQKNKKSIQENLKKISNPKAALNIAQFIKENLS